MTLSKRLILTLSVALLALIVVGSVGLWRLSQAQQRFEYVQANILPSIRELDDAKHDVGGFGRQVDRLGGLGDAGHGDGGVPVVGVAGCAFL